MEGRTVTDRSQVRRRVLIISYHFPPLTRGGVFRPLKFAKYLPEFGWDPIVLCAEPTAGDVQDPALLDQLPISVVVKRVGHLHPRQIERHLLKVWTLLWKLRLRTLARHVEPYKLLQWIPPDPYITWNRPAYQAAFELIREYQPSVILTTSPPHSTQLLGVRLKSATELSWVADFRDPWTENPFLSFPSRWHRWRNRQWEADVLSQADQVVSVTGMMTDKFRRLAGFGIPEKFITIHNGSDSKDFGKQRTDGVNNAVFRILYTGTLYGIQTANSFLAAVDKLVSDGRIPSKSLMTEFMGQDGTGAAITYRDRPWFRHTLEKSHEVAINSTMDASVLLALVPAQGSYITSSKIFEYLRTSRPILALAPLDSEAATIIRSTRTGIVVPPDDVDAIATAILILFRSWQAGTLKVDPDWTVINSFDRRKLTCQLAQVLDTLVGS